MYINTSKDSSGKMTKTGKVGKVTIAIDRKNYRLRFTHLKKRYSLTIGDGLVKDKKVRQVKNILHINNR